MWDTALRVVKAGRVPDPYNPARGVLTLDPGKGATVLDAVHLVECQPVSLVEDDAGGTRVHVQTSWRVITRPGEFISDLRAVDGVLVDGIDGVLEVVGEVGQWQHRTHGHSEFTVRRWAG